MRYVVAIVLLVLVAVGCTAAKPDPGFEAVIVRKPILFGNGGVDSTPRTTGLEWFAFSTTPVYVDMRPTQYEVHFEDLMTNDGVPLDFNAVIRVKVTDSVSLVSRFGPDWFKTNMEAEFSNRVRQAVRKHGLNETAIQTSAIEEIDVEVSTALRAYIVESELPIELIEVTVGKANPPDAIENQRIATSEQQQRALTEQQRKLAEDQRRAAELARAAADNAYREALGYTPEQYLRLATIEMQRDVCAKGGCTFIATGVSPVVAVGR